MQTNDFTVIEQQKLAELDRMKRLATGLLVLMTLVYIMSRIFHGPAWLGFVEATAEAAMIGALADWFAVTALFRHPLGLPIPHTAIIPRRKDAIADQFGIFVQQNFLSEDVISEKVRSMNLSRRVADWIVQRENAHAIAEQVSAGLAGVVRVMNDAEVQTMIERRVEQKVRDTSFSPIIGDILTFITSGRRQQELFDGAAEVGLYLLEDSDEDIQSTVKRETPWWFPASVDAAIYRRIVRSVSKMLYEMQVDIYHPMRVRLVAMVNEFLDDLKHSDDIRTKEDAIKEDLLQQPAVRDFTVTLWSDIKDALLRQSEQPDAELRQAIEDSVVRFGESIQEDETLAAKIDGWADDSARYLIRTYGHEVADLIANTIEGWDPEATSERIEVQIGKDLQFIRINGTVIGGLAGFVIHSVTVATPWLRGWLPF
ncbi:MAG: DUF445 domain-containing protein [Gammaproteobacteria bacterium]|nr:DUF445 domain-containing protein [Gammaproteobacteria bacterium]